MNYYGLRDVNYELLWFAQMKMRVPSLRAQRSNPELMRHGTIGTVGTNGTIGRAVSAIVETLGVQSHYVGRSPDDVGESSTPCRKSPDGVGKPPDDLVSRRIKSK